ncbi:hypothetical protein D3C73_952840 [compost metagenome]
MHVLAERSLAFEHAQHFGVQVERFDNRPAPQPQVIEPVPQCHPPQERLAIRLDRQQIQHRLHGFLRMPGAGVIDGDVQGEVVRIDAQLAQFIGAD